MFFSPSRATTIAHLLHLLLVPAIIMNEMIKSVLYSTGIHVLSQIRILDKYLKSYVSMAIECVHSTTPYRAKYSKGWITPLTGKTKAERGLLDT